MAASNWILIREVCPRCAQTSIIRCQTHVASSYEGTNDWPFADREYYMGEPMVWWTRTHEKFVCWRDGDTLKQSDTGVSEACYSKCEFCKAFLCAVIEFEDVTPVRVLFLGLESDWPAGYSK